MTEDLSIEMVFRMTVLEIIRTSTSEDELVNKIIQFMRSCKNPNQWGFAEKMFKECLGEEKNRVWTMFLLTREAHEMQVVLTESLPEQPQEEVFTEKKKEDSLTEAINAIFKD